MDNFRIQNLKDYYKHNYPLIHVAFLITFSAIIFLPLLSYSFIVGWDDQTFVINYYTEDGWTFNNLYSIATEFFHGQYAPVNQLYYTTLFSWFQYNPLYYHLGSIIIHLINVILVYRFIVKISQELLIRSNVSHGNIAFVTSLVFAIAPINLEPIAWIAASKVLWFALFYLLCLNFYIEYLIKKNNIYYYATLISFVISFGAKEQALTLPFTLLLLDYLYTRDLKTSIIWLEKAPLVVLSVLFAFTAFQSQGRNVISAVSFYPIIYRIPLFFFTLMEYVNKIVLPVNLSYAYPFPFPIDKKAPIWIWTYPILIPIIVYCLKDTFSKRWILFSSLFFLINIALVCNLVCLARHSLIADRYAYIPSISIYFFIAVILSNKSNKKFLNRSFITILYILYFTSYTYSHAPVWKNGIRLKEKMKTTVESRADYQKWRNKKMKK